MKRTYFSQEPKTFTICIPVDWTSGSPSPILVPARDYILVLPAIKTENIAYEEFTWHMWVFAMENRMREESMKSNPVDGTRYVDQALFRENKIKYLLKSWTLINEEGIQVPLEHHVVGDRTQLKPVSLRKVLNVSSSLIFVAVNMADQVLNGMVSPEDLLTKSEYEEMATGKLPDRLQEKPPVPEREEPSPNSLGGGQPPQV